MSAVWVQLSYACQCSTSYSKLIATYFQLGDVPISNFGVWRFVRPSYVDTLDYDRRLSFKTEVYTVQLRTIMKQLPWIIPLIRFKLPCLPSSHNTNHPIPRIRAKFREGLRTIHHEILDVLFGGVLACSGAGGDVGPFTVDGDDVVEFVVAFGGPAGFCLLGEFESDVLLGQLGREERRLERTRSLREICGRCAL